MSISDSRPDIQARTYDELFQFGGSLKNVRREHRRILPYFAGARRVLDVGCGRGVFLEMLREQGIASAGVDLSPESVRHCQALGFDEVYHEDALAFLQRHPDGFDGILCSHVVEHLPYDDALAVLRAAFAALTPGGRLAVVTPNTRDLRVIGEIFWLDPTHVRPYPLLLLDAMFRSIGFEVVHTAQPLGRPARRREYPQWLIQALLLGPYFAHPNTIIVGKRPAVG